jgi:general secretion pathway protein L
MKKTFFIRLGAEPEAGVSWLVRGDGGAEAPAGGELREAALRAQGGRVVVLAPATRMLTCVATLPPTPAARMRQALPYALEEQFAEDVERFHLAMGQRDGSGRLPVVAVERELMVHWQGLFAAAELRPHEVLNEGLALPWREGEWSLLLQENEALLRTEAYQSYAIPMAQLDDWLRLALDEQQQLPAAVRLYDAREEAVEPRLRALPAELEAVYEAVSSPLELMTRTQPAPPINLLQGEFSRKEQLGRLWRPWRATAAMLAAWLLLQGGMALADYLSLSRRDEQLYAAIEQVYRDTFPEARNVVNPRVQMERKLAELQGGGNGGSFAVLLAASAPVLKGIQGLELRNLRYKQDELELELELKDLPSLDALRDGLQKRKLAVDIRGATSGENKVESRITVREAGA